MFRALERHKHDPEVRPTTSESDLQNSVKFTGKEVQTSADGEL